MSRPPEQSRQELETMTRELQDYLLGNSLYKTISVPASVGERLIKMTLGGMLERIAEVRAGGAAGAEAVRHAEAALAQARGTQADRFFAMLGREAKSYTDSWNWFLQGCWEGDARCEADFPQEVGSRLRAERLLAFGGEHPALAETRQRLRTLDARLRARWQPGDGPLLGTRAEFPAEQYWWLYGGPRAEEG